MARHGLPSKYAKMGFKKGWAEYRKAKRHGHKSKSHHGGAKKKKKKHGGMGHGHHYPVAYISGPATTHHSKGSGSMKISKNRLAELQTKVKNALARAREAKSPEKTEIAITLAEGLVGGVGSSWVVGLIPVPASMPRPGLIKSGVQLVTGLGLALMVKNKHVRSLGGGAAIMGAAGVLRELMPVPTHAGEVDEAVFGAPLDAAGDPVGGDPLGGEDPNAIPEYMGHGSSGPYG